MFSSHQTCKEHLIAVCHAFQTAAKITDEIFFRQQLCLFSSQVLPTIIVGLSIVVQYLTALRIPVLLLDMPKPYRLF